MERERWIHSRDRYPFHHGYLFFPGPFFEERSKVWKGKPAEGNLLKEEGVYDQGDGITWISDCYPRYPSAI
jgi:hypothetical protein